jgi:hypothetical protein
VLHLSLATGKSLPVSGCAVVLDSQSAMQCLFAGRAYAWSSCRALTCRAGFTAGMLPGPSMGFDLNVTYISVTAPSIVSIHYAIEVMLLP